MADKRNACAVVGQAPAGIALDPATNVALVTNFMNNQLIAVNLTTNKTVALQLGLGGAIAPLGIAWQPNPTLGVVLMSQLISASVSNSVIVLGLPTSLLP